MYGLTWRIGLVLLDCTNPSASCLGIGVYSEAQKIVIQHPTGSSSTLLIGTPELYNALVFMYDVDPWCVWRPFAAAIICAKPTRSRTPSCARLTGIYKTSRFFPSVQNRFLMFIMPPRLHLFSTRSARLRTQPSCHTPQSASCKAFRKVSQQRWITADEKPLPTTDEPKGPNQEQLPHVSEEAAAVDKTMGEVAPDIGQGTPVQDVR